MAIVLGAVQNDNQPDPDTGNVDLQPAPSGNLLLKSGNGDTAITITDSDLTVDKNLIITNSATLGGNSLATTATTEPSLGNPSTDGFVLSSTTSGVRSWVAQSSFSGTSDDITEGSTNLFLTTAEKNKLSNSPTDTNSELSNKLDIDSTSVNVKITNNGSGNGSITFINSTATANKREYEFNARRGDYLELETNNDSGVAQKSFKFYHDGHADIPGNLSVSGTLTSAGASTFNSGITSTQVDIDATSQHLKLNTSSGTTEWSIGLSSGALRFYEDGVTTRFILEAGGDVGIGTTAPAYKLDVAGTGRFTSTLTVGGNLTTDSYFYSYRAGSNQDAWYGANFVASGLGNTSSSKAIGYSMREGSSTNPFVGNYRGATFYRYSDSSLCLGVGSGVGVENLTVSAQAITSAFISKQPFLAEQGIETTQLNIDATADHIKFLTSGTLEYKIGLSSGGLRFYENGNTTRFYIAAGGDVGIGTLSPSYKLHVVGDARISSTTTIDGNLTISGYQAAHLGNMSEILRADAFMNNTGTANPLGTSLTTQHIKDARGRQLILIGVGALSATMPTISTLGTTNGDFLHGETVTIINMNSGSAITISVPSGYQQAVGRLDITTTGSVSIAAGARVTFVAVDGLTYSSWGKKTWCAFDPSF